MGSVRTLLAILVVLAHCYGRVGVGGQLAVQIFYMISGFLISFVLVEANRYKSVLKFYSNRFLRLFPVYWAVAICSLLLECVGWYLSDQATFFQTYAALDWNGRGALALSNIFLFGQDWIMFTAVRDNVFQLVVDYKDTEVNVWSGLLVPQAWTLGLELCFYLIAPFILKKKKWIFAGIAISLLVRIYLIRVGLDSQDPWTYRFFPKELSLFLFGALSHQVIKDLVIRNLGQYFKHVSTWITGLFLLYCVSYAILPFPQIQRFLILIVTFCCLPCLFEFQKRFTWDRKLGEYSYPIYISHWMVIGPTIFIYGKLGLEGNRLLSAGTVLLLTLIISFLLERFISRNVESLRARNKVDDPSEKSLSPSN